MKKLLLMALGLALLSGCPTASAPENSSENVVENTANNNAMNTNKTANENTADMRKDKELKAYSDSSMAADERIKAINEYVEGVEKRLPVGESEGTDATLKRTETDISKDSFEDITEEKWAKMHTYMDGDTLKRLKVYSTEGEKKTEEFYFNGENIIYGFIETDGMGKKGDDSEANGDKFYFGTEGLFAMVKADGTKVDAASEEFKKYKDKLPKEAKAFRSVK